MADKQTLAQFGQSIKAKHPEYKDMDDAALGKAVLAKYPQYADMVQSDSVQDVPGAVPGMAEPGASAGPKRPDLQPVSVADSVFNRDRQSDYKNPVGAGIQHFGNGFFRTGMNAIAHPIDTAKSVGSSMGESVVASGMAPEGYPSTGPLLNPEQHEQNQQAQLDAQQHQGEMARDMIAHPADSAGGAAALALLTHGATKGAALLPEVAGAVRTAAIGDTDAAALRGLRVPSGSPKIQSTLRSVEGARPYLQGADSLEDLQSRIPAAKNEIWGKYKGTVDHLADKPVQGPDGQTTVGDLEAERQQLSALNRGIKKGSPEALQLAQQKGMSAAELLDREKAVQGALDPHLEEAGIDPKLIRQTFGQVADIGSKVSGKSTIIEPPKPYGFAKLGDLSLTKPLSNISTLGSAARDVAAGRYWNASPTDVGIREGFRTGGPKPDFRAPVSGMPAWQNAPRLLESDVPGNAGYGDVDRGSMAGTPHPGPQVGMPPPSRLALPSSTGASTAQPMIRYATPYSEPYDPGMVPFSKPEYLAPPKPYQTPLITKPLLPNQGAQ